MRHIFTVEVTKFDPQYIHAIDEVLDLNFDDVGSWTDRDGNEHLTASGMWSTNAVEATVDDITEQILEANGAPCSVVFHVTYIEEAPTERFNVSKDVAERLFK